MALPDSIPPPAPRRIPASWLLLAAGPVLLAASPPPAGTGRLENVAPQLGLALAGGGGIVLEDLDGDHRPDVIVAEPGPGGRLTLLRGRDEPGFTEATEAAGLAGVRGGAGLAAADVNGDRRLDLLVVAPDGNGTLLLQEGDGRFRDATERSGLSIPPGGVGTFADVDADGDLDLFLAPGDDGHSRDNDAADGGAAASLWRNRGDGTFEDATGASTIAAGACADAVLADLDRDGDADLFLSAVAAPNRLWRNEGGGVFTDVTESAGFLGPDDSGVVLAFDHDNDRDLDLIVTASSAHGGTRLLDNDRSAVFTDVTLAKKLDVPGAVRGAAFGDFDGDGFLDVVFGLGGDGGDGGHAPADAAANLLLRNDRGRSFEDATGLTALGALAALRCAAFADLDRDGDEDLVTGAGPGAGALIDNPGAGRLWVAVELHGAESNAFGAGAEVRTLMRNRRDYRREYFRNVGVGSTRGGSGYRQTIPLADAERLLQVQVKWPDSGGWQRFFQPHNEATLGVRQGETGLDVRFEKVVPLLPRPAP